MKRFLALAVIALCLSFFSCGLQPGSGGASFVIKLSGIVPRAVPSSSAHSPATRLILPATRSVSVQVEGSGYEKTVSAQVVDGSATVELTGLPVDVDLRFTVSSLDVSGNVLTQGVINKKLKRGANADSVRLLPPAANVGQITESAVTRLVLASLPNLPAGNACFLEITFTEGGEFQFLANTYDTQYPWLDLYDQDWNPVQYICKDEKQGWCTVSITSGSVIHVVIVPSVSGHSILLQARPARFVALGGGGAGTSTSPYPNMNISIADNSSYFIKAGSYSATLTVALSGASQHVYGGFSNAAWTDRKPDSYHTVIGSNASIASIISVQNACTGVMDGLDISADSSGGLLTTNAVSFGSSGAYVISNCVLTGTSGSFSDDVTGNCLSIASGAPEIAHCTILGGSLAQTDFNYNAIVRGINISGSGAAFIHDCDIVGGFAVYDTCQTAMASYGIYANTSTTTPIIVNRCRIFGGSALSGSGGTGSANTCGVWFGMSRTGTAILANSVISAGSAIGNDASSHGVECSGGNALIVGNTIGSGMYTGTLYPYASSVDCGTTAQTVTAAGNACIVSQAAGDSSAFSKSYGGTGFKDFASSGNVSFGTTTPYDEGLTDPPYFSPQSFLAGNNTQSAISPAAAFVKYDLSGVACSATDGAFWLAHNDWRPSATSAFVGSSNWTSLLTPYTSTYPGLLVDMVGNPRPSAGVWTRGAYQ
jgi:hypothetical protein